MKHVAIFMFPGYGHVNPTLEMSRCLIAMGHRVSYVLDEKHEDVVTAVGAEAVCYRSRRARLGDGAVSGEDIGALGLEFLRESMEEILPRTLEAFRDDVPDLILYDLESFFTARSAARRWGRPTVQLFPYVATNEKYSLAMEVFEGAGEHVQQIIDLVTGHMAAEGEDPDAAWSFMANFDDRNIVLLPREFQPMGDTFDERYEFVGHSLPAYRPGTGSWSAPGDAPAVLITLGTEVNDRPDFFETCGSAFADGGRHVVMAVGRGNLPADATLPANVEAHEWLQFSAVMPHVDAVVCHAGMSTMLEAIQFGRPLVIVTYTPEDKVNGRCVDELGLGMSLPGADVTPERLRDAVEQVANDPGIRQRVERMRMNMLSEGGPSRAALLIDGWLQEQPSPTHGEHMPHSDRGAAPALDSSDKP